MITDTFCFNIAKDDVTVLRQACQMFRRDFIEVGNVDVFLESYTIASACNKVFRKRFLKPETIGLIPSGGYICNRNYSKKTLMWILHMEEEDSCKVLHARNGSEVRLPDLPRFSVMGNFPKHVLFTNLWGVPSRLCQMSNVSRPQNAR